ncbi:hypothetical protein HPB48_008321 [Haemaphysalis longicornis]|uniref:Uncharacterized protein n=1 Tax=Haemaphysalis longicornis TaxID=44386 RepID=A0A9J6FU10_HAELO|nr:hypothetical protein HPB48_008321 [Haemaphysalis longicornis]
MHRRQPWHRKQQFFEGQDTLEYVLLVAGVLSFQFFLAVLSHVAELYHGLPHADPNTSVAHTRHLRRGESWSRRLRTTRIPDLRQQADHLYSMLPTGFRNSAFALKLRSVADCANDACFKRTKTSPLFLVEKEDVAEFANWTKACGRHKEEGEWRTVRPVPKRRRRHKPGC